VSTDEELISEILKGSHAAAEVLIKRYYRTVFAFIYRKTGDKNTAYDLTQEVFIKIMKALPKYKASGKFEHWLIKISLNVSNDYFKSREYGEKQKTVELCEINDDSNVTSIIETSQRNNEIKAAIMSLPKEQRDTLILYYYSGCKIAEIAALTETKEATVKSRLHQSLQKLRKLFSEGEKFESVR
jgi:RNA polymerase sigma-70 factor (ECF subfamily)